LFKTQCVTVLLCHDASAEDMEKAREVHRIHAYVITS
jgi:hypothetical protein